MTAITGTQQRSRCASEQERGAKIGFHNAIPNVSGQFIQSPKRNAYVPGGIVYQYV